MMKYVSVIAVLMTSVMMQACASGSVPMDDNMQFTVQSASTTAQSGWSKKSIAETDQSLYVSPKVVLSKRDIVKAVAQKDVLGDPMVIIQLTPIARLQLQSATQNAAFSTLAVIVNGYVVSVIDASHMANGASVAIQHIRSMVLAQYIADHFSQ